jgi:hypothetical protein
MLLLLDFLEGLSANADFLGAARAPISAVIFSWSMADDGISAKDFRALSRFAGRVASFRDDMAVNGRA